MFLGPWPGMMNKQTARWKKTLQYPFGQVWPLGKVWGKAENLASLNMQYPRHFQVYDHFPGKMSSLVQHYNIVLSCWLKFVL